LFEKIFGEFHNRNKDILVMGVWGKDGLELEKHDFAEAAIDLEFAGAEIADIISKIDATRVAPMNYYIKLNILDYYLLIYSLTNDYFLILLTNKEIIEGKLNFYLNIYKDQLISIL